MADVPVKLGEVLAGKYRVERVLGEGAMGVVVAARHVDIDRLVALKFIKPQRGALEEQVARIFREAKAAGRLQSEHAGKVLDVGKLDDGAPFIVMELLAGKDLAAILKERGGLPVDEALLYILQAAHAVAEAHTFGIVHRDLKPANLFLTYGPADEPIVKVLDFGVSKLGPDENALTRTGEMLGSPLYMSPEHIKCSHDVDGRSDVWSLSITLYELLAGPGATPFQGKSTYELMMRIAHEPPIPLTTYRPDLPPGLVAAITASFGEKAASRRYRSVAAFVAALAPYVPASAATYVKRIATIQFEDVPPARPTVEVQTETDAARDGGTGPTRAVSARTAPAASDPGGVTSAASAASAKPAAAGRKLAAIALTGGALVVLVGAGVGVARWRSTPDARPPDVGPVPSGSATSAPVVPPPARPTTDPVPSGAASIAITPSGTVVPPTASPSGSATVGPAPSATASAHQVARGPGGHPAAQGSAAPRTTYDTRD
jgi:serine/threonine-protein kinase